MSDPRPTERTIFLAAIEQPSPAERAAYLDAACGGDDRLRAEVEQLLAAHDRMGTVDRPALGATVDQPVREGPGDVIGPYKLLEQIGEGGFGVVFLAEQAEPVRRKVALKVLKAGMDTRQVVARFEAERQALAIMDHPNIAKVFDGGATASGRPYFVMELVKGAPITEFCDRNHLTPRQRLELFVPVCQAVQHAHQKGIIHRDLKPSNVLVSRHDATPVVKVIDFGVAKALGQSLTDKTVFTGLAQMVGTPLYMSPEQAGMSDLDVDTRSDIYSLGVLLYELLTGTTPFTKERFRQAAYDEIRRIIREEEPPKPSTRLSESTDSLPSISTQRQTEPARLTKLVRGELDWIVMKALEKDRARRYETANGFAADVLRYLADEAVQACPPSAAYRLKKFVRRNRGPVLAVTLLVLALVAGIVGTTFGMARAEKRRVEAEQARDDEAAAKRKAEQAEARTLEEFRASTDDAIEQLIGSKPELGPQEKTYLEKTLKRWQVFADRQGDDERSMAVRAEGHFRVAELWKRLGEGDAARKEFEAARDLTKALIAKHPAVPDYQATLAGTHRNLGALLADLGEREPARKEYETARDLLKALVAKRPAVPEYQHALAASHSNLGDLLTNLGEWEPARKEYETARDLLKALVATYPAVPQYQHALAGNHTNVGILLKSVGEREPARKEYEAARDLFKALVAKHPAVPWYQHYLANTHANLGNLLPNLGEREPARKEYEAARDLLKALVAKHPAVPAYQVELGGTCCNIGILHQFEEQPAKSLDWFNEAITRLEPAHRNEPRDVIVKQYLRNSHGSRAMAFDALQKHTDAVKDWDRAIELSPPAEQAGFRASRATSRLQAGQVAEAVAEVVELTKSPNWNAGQWYDFACVYAVASGKLADKKLGFADRAMESLHKAAKAGYKSAAHMKKDKDLDPIRDREDFKKLLTELETKKK